MIRILNIIFIGIFAIRVSAQLPNSAFSLRLLGGYSLSSFSQKDPLLKNRFVQVFSPNLNYNLLTKKKDLIEIGVGLYNLGNILVYNDNAGKMVNSVYNSSQVIGLPFTYYKNIDPQNNAFYIGLGCMPVYNFNTSVFKNNTTDYTETTTYQKGWKAHGTVSCLYLFKAWNRNFSLELQYMQGLMPYYKTDIITNTSGSLSTITHRGSTFQLGLSYFFLKREKEELQ